MNSLVKVPAYSKLNIEGKNFFTQNWCNTGVIWYFEPHGKSTPGSIYPLLALKISKKKLVRVYNAHGFLKKIVVEM
jgi:hypothetical protein